MNWYLAKIIFSIRVTGSSHSMPQFDEQLRVIAAGSEHEAFLKARMIGVREEETFLNTSERMVEWSFIDVADLRKLGELTDGMELESAVHEHEEADSYVRFVKTKAMSIQERTQQHHHSIAV